MCLSFGSTNILDNAKSRVFVPRSVDCAPIAVASTRQGGL